MVFTAMDDFFTSLFYGTGSWLGLLLILSLVVGLTFAWKYMGLVMLPVTVLFGITYFSNNLGWHGLIMVFTAIFILGKLTYDAQKDR